MKIKQLFKNIALTLLACSMMSCDKMMGVDSGSKLEADDHYSSLGEIYGSFMGIYASFAQTVENTVILSGLKGDLLQPTNNAPEDYWRIYKYQANPNSEINNAKLYYDVVINCNDFITRVIKYNQEVPGDIPANVYKGMISQAICFKSWSLMAVAKLYGEAKFYSTVVSSDNSSAMYPLTIDELPTFLMSYMRGGEDGMDAFNDLDWTVVLGNTSQAWPGLNLSAKALYGELALWAGQYQVAVDNFINVLSPTSSMARNLSSYGNDSWNDIFVDLVSANNKEMITIVSFDAYKGQENKLKYYFSDVAPNVYYFAPTQRITDLYASERMNADKNYTMGDQYRGLNKSYSTGNNGNVVIKYSLKESVSAYSSDAYLHLYRAAGIQLMLAEALTGLKNYDAAMAILNGGISSKYYVSNTFNAPFQDLFSTFNSGNKGIRSRVSLENIDEETLFNGCISSLDSLTTVNGKIADEVARELAFEGQRWFTLIRMGRNMAAPAFVAEQVSQKFDAADATYYSEMLKNSANWYIK
ncbi:MAG: RagB/SusD family nutrient uptake outer membrane protein [Marinifilaceae bacterium]